MQTISSQWCFLTIYIKETAIYSGDNIDHNPSSTTAHSSFHGTGISIFQFPTVENPGTAIEMVSAPTVNEVSLPNAHTVFPGVAMHQSDAEVPQRLCVSFSGHLEDRWKISGGKKWLDRALN